MMRGWLLMIGLLTDHGIIIDYDLSGTFYKYKPDCETVKHDKRIIESYQPLILEQHGSNNIVIWCEPIIDKK